MIAVGIGTESEVRRAAAGRRRPRPYLDTGCRWRIEAMLSLVR